LNYLRKQLDVTEAQHSAREVAGTQETVSYRRVRDHLPAMAVMAGGIAKAIFLQYGTIGLTSRQVRNDQRVVLGVQRDPDAVDI
jgi:hypothetical protein